MTKKINCFAFIITLEGTEKTKTEKKKNKNDNKTAWRIFLKFINNSWREKKRNHYREGGLDMWS